MSKLLTLGVGPVSASFPRGGKTCAFEGAVFNWNSELQQPRSATHEIKPAGQALETYVILRVLHLFDGFDV